MNILDTIVQYKKQVVQTAKEQQSVRDLEHMPYFSRETISLKNNLDSKISSGIIAEFKRRSPSKGLINGTADPVQVVSAYAEAGVAAASILTDTEFFGGSNEDLVRVRNAVNIPLLRKEFMIDEYQFVEAKSLGADLILLIAAILSPAEVKTFTDLAHNLGLEVLLELHGEEELRHVYHRVDMVGINNRDLRTFEVDMERSIRMAEQLGADFTLVAESGISAPADVITFKNYGFSGFLIGENFMKTNDPGHACREFIAEINRLA